MRPAYQSAVFDRAAALGVGQRTADAVADLVSSPRDSRRVLALLDLLAEVNAVQLALLLVSRGFDVTRAGSLLRAAGIDDQRPANPATLEAIRTSVVDPLPLGARTRSVYMQRTHYV